MDTNQSKSELSQKLEASRAKSGDKPPIPEDQLFLSRRQVSIVSGMSIPALAVLANKREGPYCPIPEGYSERRYERDEVLAWLRGEPIKPWPADETVPTTRRGANFRKKKKSGRGRKPIDRPGTRRQTSQKDGGE